MVVKRVSVWSAARLAGALYAAMGLVFGCILALFSLVGAGFASSGGAQEAAPAWMAVAFGAGAVVVLPVFYGVMGVVTTAIGAWLYNLFAGAFGGIEIEVE
jgi:hypothetical protein